MIHATLQEYEIYELFDALPLEDSISSGTLTLDFSLPLIQGDDPISATIAVLL
jgi:hypothetical protein